MYKLLIVDDEFNIRDGLVKGIPWNEINIEVVGTAVDGEDAFKKAEQLSPDIVISDVSMDNMNGLDFTDLLRQKNPFVKVIILSGYDNFEFVSRALELKVVNYIIKPVHTVELMKSLQKLILEIEEDRKLQAKIRLMELEIDQNKPILRERFLYDIINGNVENYHEIEIRSDFLNLRFYKDFYTSILIEVLDYQEIINNSGMKILQSQLYGIREIFYEELDNCELWSLIGVNGNIILLFGSNEPESEIRKFLTQKLEKIVSNISLLLNITISISIGGIYNSILRMSKSYKEALLSSVYNVMSPKASIISIYDVQSANGANYIYPVELENAIISILNDTEENSINGKIHELLDKIEYQGDSKNQIRIEIMGLLNVIARKAMELGVDIYQIYTHDLIDPYSVVERYTTKNQITNWLRNIITGIKIEIKNKLTANIKGVVTKSILFLKENYTNPLLSLTDVANYVFLNASYLSRIYKNETGESFVEGLTRIRLDKAKELLKDTNIKITSIAESIGYVDTRYFYYVFKKHTGLTPFEYRKSI